MRRTIQRLASVKPARYLEVGTPTGLAGLRTHGSPRSTLLFLYKSTLDKLQAEVPEHSAYRQSVEALTKHRMAIVEAEVPPGYNEWAEKVRPQFASGLKRFATAATADDVHGGTATAVERGGDIFLIRHSPPEKDIREEEWDGIFDGKVEDVLKDTNEETKTWESEPQLTAEQVETIEAKIGGGLIEEVIEVAKAELNLVDTMVQSKVWESLEEKPDEGQWVYFERKV